MNIQTPRSDREEDSLNPTDEFDLLAEIKARDKEATQKRKEWIDNTRECYDMVAGSQWSPEDLQILKDQQRPSIVFNRIGPVLDVVGGLEVTNRQEVRYVPRELGDAKATELYTEAGKWVRDQCNAEDEESEAFMDMAISGEGWTETRLDYEYDSDGQIIIERIDPLEMFPDARSRRKNYDDSEYVFRKKLVDPRWIKQIWPEKADEIDAEKQLSREDDEDLPGHITRVSGDQYRSPWTTTDPKRTDSQVTLIEYQVKRREPFYRVIDPTTRQEVKLDKPQYDKLSKRMGAMNIPLQAVKQMRCKHYRAFVVGEILLEYKLCADPESFSYKAMTAKRDRNKGHWYGLVKGMVDPQKWANKWLAQSMHILNTSAKGGVMYEKTAVEKASDFEASWADPRKATMVSDGALSQNRIQPKVPPPFPQTLDKLLEFAVSSIRDVSGVSVELLGMTDRNQPAALELQRKQAGITILATLFDALRKYRKEQGLTLLYMIKTYISDGRMIRIVGKEMAEYVPLTKVDGDMKFDVIIDESPSSPNQKERTWAVLQTVLPIMANMGIKPPQAIIDYLPLPQSLIDKVKQPDPQAQQMEQANIQLGMDERQAKVEKDKASAARDMAEAQKAGRPEDQSAAVLKANLEVRESEAKVALVEAQIAKIMADIQAEGGDQGQSTAQAELILKQQELQLKAAQLAADIDHQDKALASEHEREMVKMHLDAQNNRDAAGQNSDTKNKSDSGMAAVGAGLQALAKHMDKPRKIIRGPDDKIAGVE